MSETLAQRLKFLSLRENLSFTVGGCTSVSKQEVLATVSSCSSSYVASELKIYILSKVTSNLLQRSIDVPSLCFPVTFYDLLSNAQWKLSDPGLILRNIKLWWTAAVGVPEACVVSYSTVALSTVPTEELYEELAKLLELESCRVRFRVLVRT